MLVIAVSFGAPSFPVALAEADCSRECCCAGACHCPMSQPCGPSCGQAPAPLTDRETPVRPAEAPTVHFFAVTDAFSAAVAQHFLSPAAFDRCDLNASPPLGGNPQQALLRLWRI